MLTKGSAIHWKYFLTRKERARFIRCMSSKETIAYIIQHRCSVSRFGDGEFQMISNGLKGGSAEDFKVDSFQPFNSRLSELLYDVITRHSQDSGFLVCIPYPLIDSSVYKGYDRIFFEREWLGRQEFLRQTIGYLPTIGDTTFTRFYLHRTDINNYPQYIAHLKKIWDKQDIVFVEGMYSRLGMGNDLFDNANSIQRILCPARDAFAKYNEIFDFLKTQDKKKLFLLALGHTATRLAYDLYVLGYWVIDVGHIDIEYEWYKINAKEKVPIPHKYVNETKSGRISNDSLNDELYRNQIIKTIV